MQQVNRDEEQSRLPELLDAALRGEEIYITGEGVVRVQLVPVLVRRGTPQFGSAKGMFTMSDDFDEPLPEFGVR